MIVVRLTGGLGNQMFQYAFGRKLAERQGPLYLDVSAMGSDSGKPRYGRVVRDFELGHLAITGTLWAPEQQEAYWRHPFGVPGVAGMVLRKVRRLAMGLRVLQEPMTYRVPSENLELGGNRYLKGWWQDERYFISVKDVILREFALRDDMGLACAPILAAIASGNSVGLHIRRTDYLTTAALGTLSIDYYQEAMAHLEGQVPNPHYFVFSDDLAWAREHLPLGERATFVDVNRGADSYKDLFLMAACRHQIIANSTFSWWAAWLNSRRRPALVIAPRRWAADPNHRANGKAPADWIRI